MEVGNVNQVSTLVPNKPSEPQPQQSADGGPAQAQEPTRVEPVQQSEASSGDDTGSRGSRVDVSA